MTTENLVSVLTVATMVALVVIHQWVAKRAARKRAADKAEQLAAEELMDATDAANERLKRLRNHATRLAHASSLAAAPEWYPQNLRDAWTDARNQGLDAALRLEANLPETIDGQAKEKWREGIYYQEQSADDRQLLNAMTCIEQLLPRMMRAQAMLALEQSCHVTIEAMRKAIHLAKDHGFVAAAKEAEAFEQAADLVYKGVRVGIDHGDPQLHHFLFALGPMIDCRGALYRLQYAMADAKSKIEEAQTTAMPVPRPGGRREDLH